MLRRKDVSLCCLVASILSGSVGLAGSAELKLQPGLQPATARGISVETDFRYVDSADNLPTSKIFGGTPVAVGEFRQVLGVVKLSSQPKGRVQCTGTLIEPDVVVTAGHCVCAGIDDQVMVGNVEREGLLVRVLGSANGLADCEKLASGRDLGVLLLEKPLEARAAPIAAASVINSATSYRVVGFGLDETGASGRKKETIVPRASNDCLGKIPGTGRTDKSAYGCVPGKEIVAGKTGLGRDTCNGDSGGPLFVSAAGTGSSSDGSYLLAGVTSRATVGFEESCGNGGIYVRLTDSNKAWIASSAAALRTRARR